MAKIGDIYPIFLQDYNEVNIRPVGWLEVGIRGRRRLLE